MHNSWLLHVCISAERGKSTKWDTLAFFCTFGRQRMRQNEGHTPLSHTSVQYTTYVLNVCAHRSITTSQKPLSDMSFRSQCSFGLVHTPVTTQITQVCQAIIYLSALWSTCGRTKHVTQMCIYAVNLPCNYRGKCLSGRECTDRLWLNALTINRETQSLTMNCFNAVVLFGQRPALITSDRTYIPHLQYITYTIHSLSMLPGINVIMPIIFNCIK